MSDSIQGAQGIPLGSNGGPRSDDHYAQQKQEYYSSPVLNELTARRRVLEARRDQAVTDLDVICSLLRILVD